MAHLDQWVVAELLCVGNFDKGPGGRDFRDSRFGLVEPCSSRAKEGQMRGGITSASSCGRGRVMAHLDQWVVAKLLCG